MPKITIDQERCKSCLLCISFCPRKLIKVDTDLNSLGVKPVKFMDIREECLGCMQCALICPDCCIEVWK
ncbi:MAG: 4Fe-4S binding protein [Candidatus Omnitrophica bacterium]|nr:4Fe-4S binding protein [Candidatus Omnitrophota bacterium]MBU1871901.1 4Fe-4S binding protein [Candidatus Omnitrophota bacterium]